MNIYKNYKYNDKVVFNDFYQTLDALALAFIMDHVTPSQEILNEAENRDQWMAKVEMFKAVVERLLSSFDARDILIGEECRRIAVENRYSILYS